MRGQMFRHWKWRESRLSAHLAHSTPEAFRFSSSDVNGYNTLSIADGGPQQRGGYIKAPTGPGLGVAPYLDVLGKAVLTIA
jgi:cis-L-3-hydroxyproline dehydratase